MYGPLVRMQLVSKPLSVAALRTMLNNLAKTFDGGRGIGFLQFAQSGDEVSVLMDYIPYVWDGKLESEHLETMRWLMEKEYIQHWHVAKE